MVSEMTKNTVKELQDKIENLLMDAIAVEYHELPNPTNDKFEMTPYLGEFFDICFNNSNIVDRAELLFEKQMKYEYEMGMRVIIPIYSYLYIENDGGFRIRGHQPGRNYISTSIMVNWNHLTVDFESKINELDDLIKGCQEKKRDAEKKKREHNKKLKEEKKQKEKWEQYQKLKKEFEPES